MFYLREAGTKIIGTFHLSAARSAPSARLQQQAASALEKISTIYFPLVSCYTLRWMPEASYPGSTISPGGTMNEQGGLPAPTADSSANEKSVIQIPDYCRQPRSAAALAIKAACKAPPDVPNA